MHHFCINRRSVLGLIGSTILTSPGFAESVACAELQRARLLAQAGVQGVGTWVATEAPTILSNARIKLDELKMAMPAAGESLDQARRAELLDLIGLVGGSTLLIVGIVGAPAATLILAGMALSTGLLIARGLTAPNTLDPQEVVALQTVSDIERSLVAAGSSGPIAARSAANTAGTLVGGATTAYSFMVWLNSLNGTIVAEAEFDALHGEMSTIEAAFAPLDDANAMRAVRFDAMTALERELSAFPCTALD